MQYHFKHLSIACVWSLNFKYKFELKFELRSLILQFEFVVELCVWFF
jgi:hypothetical protein